MNAVKQRWPAHHEVLMTGASTTIDRARKPMLSALYTEGAKREEWVHLSPIIDGL